MIIHKNKNEVIEYLKEEFPNRIPILITNEDEF